jgi:crotonobetainyl-CoA:carnitine CoA-transferase CaiB-like acyl-CoA transferase
LNGFEGDAQLMQMPLEDVKILDLSHALAGPFCSTMLGDFGAQIVKVEPPNSGDIARAWGPPFYNTEAAYFVSLHRNKKSIEIDFKHPQGKALFFRLVEKFDVVLENYRVGTLHKLGLGYEQARQHNPGIIYCSVSGFGQDGPYRDRAALDLIVQAESGMISITGEPGGRGVRCGVSIADMVAGMNAAFGIMNALRVKDKTGQGQYVDVSMLEGQLGLLQGTIGAYRPTARCPSPWVRPIKPCSPIKPSAPKRATWLWQWAATGSGASSARSWAWTTCVTTRAMPPMSPAMTTAPPSLPDCRTSF